jgi:mono/diheme cytochrome c family protein
MRDFGALFAENCSGCHGPQGRDGAAQPLNDPLYLRIVPRDELRRTIENGRPGTSMPAFARNRGGPLDAPQITAVVDGMEHTWAGPVDLSGASAPAYSAASGDAAAGAVVFAGACSGCHGNNGAVGPIVNQSYLTLVSDQGLRTAVIVGRPRLGMPDWKHQAYHGGLSEDDISNVVAWLSSQRQPITQVRRQRQAGPNEFENGTGRKGESAKGNEGSGNGPGSPGQRSQEDNRGSGSSSIQGGPGASEKNTTPIKHQ